jgi:hypothetical protein
MKTKLKISGIIVLLLVIAFLQIKTAKQNDVSLLNIEALATGESGNISCFHTGSVVCPFTDHKVYVVF